ncbi:hypothetical protein H8356DRAFT_1431505 [Neocallimastix lanati (nom. inval.)]|nr:hypothetical protein H8356DRAFT_1431505 [Neocallimastix sp. JGI-2020a]
MKINNQLQFDTEERGHLSEQLLKSSLRSTVPYIVGLANTIPIISSSFELLFERFSKNTFITKSAVSKPIVRNSIFEDLSCDSGESLVDTTRSILKMLLFFLDLIGDHVITHTEVAPVDMSNNIRKLNTWQSNNGRSGINTYLKLCHYNPFTLSPNPIGKIR